MSLRSRDTGFPESFCGSRNTSRPHPEANLSPDASISEEDVNPEKALIRYRMSFMSRQELESPSSSALKLTSSSEEGALSAFSRLAIGSLRAAELPSLDALLGNKDGASIESSDGMSSRDPDSPLQQGAEFEKPKVDHPSDAKSHYREGRRKSHLLKRLIHHHK
ncbi:hypothetical protein N0V88_002347 [Collariella sp. IMI 366227]|nr:hypothetical protein N0V88_002347 [Collariella sp. IMI 366227]